MGSMDAMLCSNELTSLTRLLVPCLIMSLKDTMSIPAQARHLAARHAIAGFDGAGSLCWLFANAKLVVWAAENMSSPSTTSLPYPAPHAAVSVAALQVADAILSLEYDMKGV